MKSTYYVLEVCSRSVAHTCRLSIWSIFTLTFCVYISTLYFLCIFFADSCIFSCKFSHMGFMESTLFVAYLFWYFLNDSSIICSVCHVPCWSTIQTTRDNLKLYWVCFIRGRGIWLLWFWVWLWAIRVHITPITFQSNESQIKSSTALTVDVVFVAPVGFTDEQRWENLEALQTSGTAGWNPKCLFHCC